MLSKKINKKIITIASSDDLDSLDIKFWKSKTPSERLEAIEIMRQINFNYDPTTERLQRFFTIAQRA